MTRFATMFPLSLGLFLACSDVDPASVAGVETALLNATEGIPIEVDVDIQPYAENPIVNLGMGGVITVAVRDVDGFVYTIDPLSVEFEAASPAHDLTNETLVEHHIKTITILAPDGVTVLDSYLAFLFHFRAAETQLEASAEPVEACLTGTAGGVPFFGCDTVLVRERKGRDGQESAPGRRGG